MKSPTELCNKVKQLFDGKRSPMLYFVTLTLKPKMYKYSSKTQFEITSGDVYDIINRSSVQFVCIPEHTAVGNVHYHAVVLFRDKSNVIMFNNKVKKIKSLGMTKITPTPIESLEQLNRSCEYLFKELDLTKKCIDMPLQRLVMSDHSLIEEFVDKTEPIYGLYDGEIYE